MNLIKWSEMVNDDDIPNVVNLNVSSDPVSDGAAWVYLPSKDTIYIGPEGSHAMDIAAVLKKLDTADTQKPVTGIMFNDGYVDYFKSISKEEEGRILRALQIHHENYGGNLQSRDFNDVEDEEYGDVYEAYQRNKSLHSQGLDYDPDRDDDDDTENAPELDDTRLQDWLKDKWSEDKDYSVMKPTPGIKSIHDWDVSDYLDWRDKKHWTNGSSWSPREDYPHWRWSFGNSALQKGAPHQGLWVWPTEHGYPDHFSQTGSGGLGNCAQGRIYPHENDVWEILTWADRPRNAPDYIKQQLQHQAEQAVKDYLMEKLGVPEDKIYFNPTTYGAGVSWYNSPSYPGNDSSSYSYTPQVRVKYEPTTTPVPWETLNKGDADVLFDPEGNEWSIGAVTTPKDVENGLFIYKMDGKYENREIDKRFPPAGWVLGTPKKKDDDDIDYDDSDGSATYKYNDQGQVTPTPKMVQYDKWPEGASSADDDRTIPQGTNHMKKIIKNETGTHELTYHPNGRMTSRRLSDEEAKNYQTPEERWEEAVQKFDKEYAKGQATIMGDRPEMPDDTMTLDPDNMDQWVDSKGGKWELMPDKTWREVKDDVPILGQRGYTDHSGQHYTYTPGIGWSKDDLTEEETDEEKKQRYLQKWYPDLVQTNPLTKNLEIPDGAGHIIKVSPEDYELAYRLHGENWWKSFIPNRNLTGEPAETE